MTIIEFDTLDSTNRYCRRMDLRDADEFTVVWAHRQTDGIGQRGNHWVSDGEMNLTFSLVLHPTFLPPSQQYELTKAMALGVSDWLINAFSNHLSEIQCIDNPNKKKRQAHTRTFLNTATKPTVQIKWPNDIYVRGRKICGMLIENYISEHYEAAVCGIGVNVNQTEFSNDAPNATSLKAVTGRDYELQGLLEGLLNSLQKRYAELIDTHRSPTNTIDREYLQRLMNLGKECRYLYNETEIWATITGVSNWGHLLLITDKGEKLECAMKEIKLVE